MLKSMQLLATIYPQDVDPDAPAFDYAAFRPRTASRAIVFEEQRVALVHVKHAGYYMLPGGGADKSENIHNALLREVQEELGCHVHLDREIGSIVTYFDRWQQKQTDTCFLASKVAAEVERTLTDFEISEAFEVTWAASLEEAVRLMREATPAARDGKLVQARDLRFLESL